MTGTDTERQGQRQRQRQTDRETERNRDTERGEFEWLLLKVTAAQYLEAQCFSQIVSALQQSRQDEEKVVYN